MADLATMERALRNADAAGDVEAARTISQAIRQQQVPPLTRADKFGRGLRDPIDGGAQLLTKMLPSGMVNAGNQMNNWLADKTGMVGRLPEGGVDQQVRQGEAAHQSQRKAAGESGIDGYRLLGNVLNPVNVGIGASIPTAAASLGGRMALGAAGGAASSALQPVVGGDFASEKAKQIGTGAIFGGAVPGAVAGLGRVISPKASVNPQLQMLKDAGVQPTVGQSLGGRWNSLEEKMQSLPIMGDAIATARGKSLDQFNIAAINRATAPIGFKVQSTGQEGVRKAGDAITDAYEAGKTAMGHFALDQRAVSELSTLKQMAQNLPQKERAAFDSAWSYLGSEVSPNGSILAGGFKRIDSKLGADAARFSGSSDAYQKQAGDALKELQRIVTDAAKRANPKAAKMLDSADEAWANLVRVEGAAKAAINNGGVFTPAQLNMAARQADTSVRDRATARGTALMQDLGNAGQGVLGNKVPNSGTAERLMYGGGAAIGGYFLNPAIPAGLLASAGLYTGPFQGLLRGAVSSRPAAAQTIEEMLNRSSSMLGPTGGLLGLELLK